MTSTTTQRIAYVEPWTADRVMARLMEAANTLKTAATGSMPSGRVTWWPDMPFDRPTSYSALVTEARKSRVDRDASRQVADAEQIDRMDQALSWLSRWLSANACAAAGLPHDAGNVLWARAGGLSFEAIRRNRSRRYGGETRGGGPSRAIPGGNSTPSLLKIVRAALAHIVANLNRTGEAVNREVVDVQPAAPAARRRDAPKVQGIRALTPARS